MSYLKSIISKSLNLMLSKIKSSLTALLKFNTLICVFPQTCQVE